MFEAWHGCVESWYLAPHPGQPLREPKMGVLQPQHTTCCEVLWDSAKALVGGALRFDCGVFCSLRRIIITAEMTRPNVMKTNNPIIAIFVPNLLPVDRVGSSSTSNDIS